MRGIVSFMLIVGLPLSGLAQSRLDSHVGNELLVHYVALRGDMKLDLNRRAQLTSEYTRCAEINQKLGREVAPLPAGGIPAVTLHQDFDLYYGEGQSLTEIRGVLYSIDRSDCKLVRRDMHELKIYKGSARCDVDLIKNEKSGFCNDGRVGSKPAFDRSKVPPHMQHLVDEQIARLQREAPARRNIAAPISGSGKMKNVAGLRCEVYAVPGGEKCIARPADSRFDLTDGPLNAGMPGLLLELDDPTYSLRATDIKLNLGARRSFFTPPASARNPGSGAS